MKLLAAIVLIVIGVGSIAEGFYFGGFAAWAGFYLAGEVSSRDVEQLVRCIGILAMLGFVVSLFV